MLLTHILIHPNTFALIRLQVNGDIWASLYNFLKKNVEGSPCDLGGKIHVSHGMQCNMSGGGIVGL